MPTFNPKAEQPKTEILKGTFPFEIIAVDAYFSSGAKTNGCPCREVKLAVFRDKTFAEKIATVNDNLIDHPSCDWKFSVLAKCVGAAVKDGEAFDVDDGWIGFRGWAEFAPEDDKKDPSKKWNRVRAFLTSQPMLPRNPNPVVPNEPAAPTGGDENNPFN